MCGLVSRFGALHWVRGRVGRGWEHVGGEDEVVLNPLAVVNHLICYSHHTAQDGVAVWVVEQSVEWVDGLVGK